MGQQEVDRRLVARVRFDLDGAIVGVQKESEVLPMEQVGWVSWDGQLGVGGYGGGAGAWGVGLAKFVPLHASMLACQLSLSYKLQAGEISCE